MGGFWLSNLLLSPNQRNTIRLDEIREIKLTSLLAGFTAFGTSSYAISLVRGKRNPRVVKLRKRISVICSEAAFVRLWKEVEFGHTLQLLQDSSREVRLIPRLLRFEFFISIVSDLPGRA